MFCWEDKGTEERAVGVFWVTDGIDRCLVGFLPKRCIARRNEFDGKIAQVVEFLKESDDSSERSRSRRMCGICTAAIINAE